PPLASVLSPPTCFLPPPPLLLIPSCRLSLLLFFFLYSAPDHSDLPSFPTRRSSDLEVCRQHQSIHNQRPSYRLRRFEWAVEVHRSEEHTSELQSHLNLVCRLLLEKKKKYKA